MELRLFQTEVAKRIRASIETVIAWEKDRKEPEYRYWRGIIDFLGYDPNPEPRTLGDRLRAKYRELGIPRKSVAARLGMDENTLRYYERGTWAPTTHRAQRLIEEFLSCRGRSRE